MATASLLGGKGACDFCAPTVYQYDSNGHVDCTVRQPQRLDETRSSLHVASCVERKHAHATRRHTPRHDDTRHVCQMGHSGTRVGHCVSMTVLCGCTWSGCHHVIKSSSHHGITSSRQHIITSSRHHDSTTARHTLALCMLYLYGQMCNIRSSYVKRVKVATSSRACPQG